MQIIDIIHRKTGIVSSDPTETLRFERPKPGDVVDFGENEGKFPFIYGRYGRIDDVGGWGGPGTVHICCGSASVFLNCNGSVDISGGPFECVKQEDLIATFTCQRVRFWNWGNNSPGAGRGCEYFIDRPVFRLKTFSIGGRKNGNYSRVQKMRVDN